MGGRAGRPEVHWTQDRWVPPRNLAVPYPQADRKLSARCDMARTVRTNGARLVQLYLDAGLTQDELAHRCGCTPNTVRKAERGGPVALGVLREIAEALDVPFRDLLAGSGGPAAGAADPWFEGWPDRLV